MAQPSGGESVLIGGIEKVEIRIADYDPEWPRRFKIHEERVKSVLGATALRIEHIGSTSVPRLAAKPIIDILLVVPDSSDEGSFVPALESAGYELRVREPEFDEHRMLRTSDRDVHLHVFSPSSIEIDRYLSFREALRKSAAERELYAETKRRLAAQNWRDGNAYADAKTDVVEAILKRAGFAVSRQG